MWARETPRSCSFPMDERSVSTPAGWRRPTFDIGATSHLAGVLGARRSPARLHERDAWRRRPHRRRGERVQGFQAVRSVGRGARAASCADARAARARGRAGTAWRTLQPADRVSFGNVDLVVHHPPRPEWERQRVRNDDSEVLEIRYGGVSFVFTGDIGREVERTIAASFARAPIRILKVPHHGSATSSSQTVSRRTAARHRRHQRGTRESIRPPGAERPGAVPEHRRRDLSHRSGWGRDGGDRRCDCQGDDIHRTETDADHEWAVIPRRHTNTNAKARRARRHEGG